MTKAALAAALLASVLAGAVQAAGQPDHPWPPDASKYDPPGTEVAPGLKVGDTLDQSNADKAKDLLPPEILKHYKDGGYRNEIGSRPEGVTHPGKTVAESTPKNAS